MNLLNLKFKMNLKCTPMDGSGYAPRGVFSWLPTSNSRPTCSLSSTTRCCDYFYQSIPEKSPQIYQAIALTTINRMKKSVGSTMNTKFFSTVLYLNDKTS